MDDDPETYVSVMDAAGVDKSCINCIFYGDVRRSNDTMSRFVDLYPDRFLPVAYVTPRYLDEAMPELERAFDVLGAKFLKIYPNYLTKPVDDPAYDPIFEWADERGIVIMCHSSHVADFDIYTIPTKFIEVASRYQRVTWVLAHSGNSMRGQIEAVEAAQACPNIVLETCTSFGEHGTIEFLVEGAGEDRVVFGSDMALMDARWQVGRIVTADLSDEAKRKILGLNAIRILGLDS
jgi:predicted TIM-barrel fold metal-dependent hydrolase